MKKTLAVTMLAAIVCAVSAFAAPTAKDGVIPSPQGQLPNHEGAWSAPAEINHADSPYFKHVNVYELESINGRRVIMPHYPSYQQTTEYTCGPAAALTMLYWYGRQNYDELTLAKEMKTRPYPYGTNVKDMVKFFEKIGWQVESSLHADKISRYEDFQDFVWYHLEKGRPILVENVEWGGHWRVIIGYDTMGTESTLDDMLILADPYDTCDHNQDGYTTQNAQSFFSMWFDHFILPKSEQYQPWIVAYPKD